jgi:hypothetical protein
MPDERPLFKASSEEQKQQDPLDGCLTFIALEVVLALLMLATMALESYCSSA